MPSAHQFPAMTCRSPDTANEPVADGLSPNGLAAAKFPALPAPSRRLIVSASAHVAAAGVLADGLARLLERWGGVSQHDALLTLACYALIAVLTLRRLDRHAPHTRFGNANRVTLLRGVLASILAGMLPHAAELAPAALWLAGGIGMMALLFDGIDGWIARRQRIATLYGAGFDIDMDTVLMGILALLLWQSGKTGIWVLGIGLLRHLFVAAGVMWPALRGELPHSERRRIVCAVQNAVLAVCLTPVLAPPLTSLASGAALGVLLFSFAIDTFWLFKVAGDGRK
jgi:phosphatidylglycerophosphate synthase